MGLSTKVTLGTVCVVLSGGFVLSVVVAAVKMFANRTNAVRVYVSRRAKGVSVAGFWSAVIRSRAAAAAMSVVAAVGMRKSVGSQSTVSLFLVAIVLTIQHL